MQIDAPPKPERTYVTVLPSIDQSGLMEPREIIWPDGRKFPIDKVECWRKALDHDPDFVVGFDLDPVNQLRNDQVLGFVACLIEALCPG